MLNATGGNQTFKKYKAVTLVRDNDLQEWVTRLQLRDVFNN